MFDRIHEFPEQHACRRLVLVYGQQFEIAYVERSGPEGIAQHAISDRQVVAECAEALAASYRELISTRFGWRDCDINQRATEICRVKLKNLGPRILGAAIVGTSRTGEAESYLVLNVRALESSRKAAISRRRAAIVHELCHLLQFETATYRYWPAQGRWGLGDPNWWLHEACALAMEAAICDDSPECYPLFWEWATTPSRSLDADDAGGFAAPFLMYLMRALPQGDRLPSEIYRVEPQAVSNMGGTDLLDHVLQLRGKRLAAVSGDECFASGFCVDAAFIGTPDSVLDSRICDVVGPRSISEVFDKFPFQDAATDYPVDHLGCRYFHFHLPPESRGLCVTVRPQQPEGMTILRCESVLVGHDGRKLRQVALDRHEHKSELRVELSLDSPAAGSVLLVVANCAWGTRQHRCNHQTYSISANIW